MARVPQASPGVSAVEIRPIAPAYQQTSGLLVDAIQSRGASQNIERAAQKIEGAGDMLAQEAVKQQMEDNEREAKKADIALSEKMRAIMFGDGTPENPGFYGLKGEAALAAYPKVREQMAEARKQIGGTLTNAKAREMFELSAAGRFDTEGRSMDRHNMQERIVANDTVSVTRIREANDGAIAGWNDPQRVAQQEAIIRGEIYSMGQRNGWSPEVINSRIQEEQSKMYYGMIKAALGHSALDAQKLYDQYKPAIDGSLRPAIEKELEAGTVLQETQINTDRIMGMKGLSDAAREAEAKAIKDPKVREDTLRAVRHEIDRRTAKALQGEALADKAALRSASLFVQQGGSFIDWQKANPTEAARVMGIVGATENLYRAERQVAEGSIYSRTTDGKTLDMIRKMETKDLSEIDLETYKPVLTKPEYDKALSLQTTAQHRMRSVQEDQSIYNSGHSALAKYAPTKIVNGVQKPDVDHPDYIAARNELDAYIKGFTDQGKKPSKADIDAEAARLMLPIQGDVAPNNPFQSSFKTIGGNAKFLTEEQRKVATVPIKKIPPDLLYGIRNRFVEAGIANPTNSQIENFAGALATKDRERAANILGGK